jgi:hypothetical protein
VVTGTATASTVGVAVTLTGAAAFTSSTSYYCVAQNTFSTASRLYLKITSGSSFTVSSQNGTPTYSYICIGS